MERLTPLQRLPAKAFFVRKILFQLLLYTPTPAARPCRVPHTPTPPIHYTHKRTATTTAHTYTHKKTHTHGCICVGVVRLLRLVE